MHRKTSVCLSLIAAAACCLFGGCTCAEDTEKVSEEITGQKNIERMNKMKKEIEDIQKKKREEMEKALPE